jgi:hypothetical protein
LKLGIFPIVDFEAHYGNSLKRENPEQTAVEGTANKEKVDPKG